MSTSKPGIPCDFTYVIRSYMNRVFPHIYLPLINSYWVSDMR